jgi:hypothetical protein
MLILVSASLGQATVVLGTVTANPGESVSVPINVTNFIGIGSVTLKIRYNPAILTYTGISDAATGISANATDSTIHISFFTSNASGQQTFPDGIFLKLKFVLNGVITSSLSFLNTCEVTQGLTPIFPLYTNGSVLAAATNNAKISIIGTNAVSGTGVTVPIKFEGFSNAGALTLKIQYDQTRLSFVNISATGTLSGASANVANGIITIAWYNANGADINSTDKLKLNFIYNGNTATNLNFYSGCLVSDNTPTNIAVSYFNGTINPIIATTFAELGSYTTAVQGNNFEIPLTFSSFAATGNNSIAAITLNINYDNSKLVYIGPTNNTKNANVNYTGNTISITWSSPDPNTDVNINGEFLKLKFRYIGVGNANVTFGTGCVFSNKLTNNEGVNYTNSVISPDVTNRNASIGIVSATQGSQALVPVSFDNLPADMGAVTLFLNYDVSKMTYLGVTDNTFNSSVNQNSPGSIAIAWSSSAATDINSTTVPFLKLKFLYNNTSNNCVAVINFATGCELVDQGVNIIPANWENGNVNSTPAAPTGTATQSFCSGASPTVTNLVATGTDIKWYDASTAGNLLVSSAALSTASYYATQTISGCESSDRLLVTATVNTTPAAPTGTQAQSFCSGASPAVTNLVATGTDIKWYDASTTGNLVAGTTALVTNTHYFASQTENGCESSDRFDVTATVNTTPAAPTGTATQSFCSGTSPKVTNLVWIITY